VKKFNIKPLKRLNIKLARREKVIVFTGAAFLGLFLISNFLVLPALSMKSKLRNRIQLGQKQMEEIILLSSEYNALQGNSGDVGKALSARGKSFTLFSLLEKVASQAGLKDRIKYIKPSTSQAKGKFKISSVEMNFQAITMGELFNYLYRVEDPKNIIKVKRLSIKKHKEKQGHVDATLQISTVQPAS
jgi:type II secretory pathway component PulM